MESNAFDVMITYKRTLYASIVMPSSDNTTNTVDMAKSNQPVKKESVKGLHMNSVLAGRYHLQKVIGTGGMGEIYLAIDKKLQRQVAIKMMLHPEEGSDNKRFELESQTVAGFSDPHTIRLFDYGITEEGYQYQVIEYLDGCNVKEYLKKNGTLKPTIAKAIGIQICGSLAEAHRKNILHRDIKPSNIMLVELPERGLHAKLLDFGLARADNHDPTITKTGMVLGSPMYMSPEQIDNKSEDLTPLTDVYSLGLTLYTIVTGKTPFVGGSLSSILASQLFHSPPPLTEVMPSLASEPALCWAIETAVKKNPAERFSSINQMKKALTLALRKPKSSLYIQNQNLYCDDECVYDDSSSSIGAISLTDNLSLGKDAVETINQPKPTKLTAQGVGPQGAESTKSALALASLLLICVGVFIWSELFKTTTVQGQSNFPTPTTVSEQPEQIEAPQPEMFRVDITTTPSGAKVYLNEDKIGTTPTTLELSQEATGTLILKRDGYKAHSLSWPTENTSLDIKLSAKPTINKAKPKQSVSAPKKVKKSTKTKSKGVKDVSNPFE